MWYIYIRHWCLRRSELFLSRRLFEWDIIAFSWFITVFYKDYEIENFRSINWTEKEEAFPSEACSGNMGHTILIGWIVAVPQAFNMFWNDTSSSSIKLQAIEKNRTSTKNKFKYHSRLKFLQKWGVQPLERLALLGILRTNLGP